MSANDKQKVKSMDNKNQTKNNLREYNNNQKHNNVVASYQQQLVTQNQK